MKKLLIVLVIALALVGCNEKEIKKTAALAGMFVAVTDTLMESNTFNADALLKPTAEALVRLAFAKDPGAKAKVAEIAAFVSDGVDDGTFITLAEIEWGVLESIPQDANPLWSALVPVLGLELRELAAKRGLTEARIHVDVKRLLAMVVRIAGEG